VSLVSVWGRNWCYLCGTVEVVAECDIVEIANIHAVFMQVAEKMIGYEKRLGEYPTLSARCLMSRGWSEDLSADAETSKVQTLSSSPVE